jgi:UDP-N-acetylmuramoylalanine--D-glutamate ligase
MDLKDKKVLVVGMGKTGKALCNFLFERGAKIMISEIDERNEIPEEIRDKAFHIEIGRHTVQTFEKADLIVVSPGVPMFIEPVLKAKEKGVKVIAEIELAFSELKGEIIGITGSNGKSTTVTLTHKIISDSGRRAYLCGNIGNPLISFVKDSRDDDIYVVELSSFQLEGIEKFRPKISSILNITPDHLDRYHEFNEYVEAKKRIFVNQHEEDFAVMNLDDPISSKFEKEIKAELYFFSRERNLERGAFVQRGKIYYRDSEKDSEIMEVNKIPLIGVHNLENVLASITISVLSGVDKSGIEKSVMEFRGLEHRMEYAGRIGNVLFYNDSKATNVDASLKSIQSFDKDIVIIMGGRDKGGDFSVLKDEIKKRVKGIVLIGEAKEKIRKTFSDICEMKEAEDMGTAVKFAFEMAYPYGIVILAPGCASFDMFKNFEHRGKVFKEEVLKLIDYHEKK